MICREILNGGTENVEKIPYVHEQQFFLLLKRKLPRIQIIYEESAFGIEYDDGTTKTTKPDFFIKPDAGKRVIIEITTASKEEDHLKEKSGKKSKREKIKLMKLVAPNQKYVVLYREHLLNIQKHNPWVDFFGAKKIREKESTLESSI